ncbi:hypothetical protein WMY93_009207 [Mugilogobius chulae]|uniref:Immunoglobulin-binding protein 1 n=1 Tax=Mugilogobius chulae TaxID=88201 RepID=A0AAW0PK03_9GOBI
MAESEPSSEPVQSSSSDGSEADSVKLSELLERGWSTLDELESTQEPLASTPDPGASTAGYPGAPGRLPESGTARALQQERGAGGSGLSLKQTSRERRLDILQTARAYFVDYLRRCKNYNISQFNMPKCVEGEAEESTQLPAPPGHGQPNLVAMAAQRQTKIQRYREKKEVEAELEAVKRAVDSGQADEETSRRFYLLHLRRWISLSLEEVESIDQEIPIVRNMSVLKNHPARDQDQPRRAPMKPFILTKDAVQAQVFGAGYPSLPTMTVDEWYSQHQRHGVLPDQGVPRRVPVEEDRDAAEVQEEQKEIQAEREDEEALQKARNWDDYKDTHRRGYGNRHNMG